MSSLDEFENRLKKRFRHLRKWAGRENLQAYRIYDRDMPEHPFSVDIYRDCALIAAYHRPGRMPEGDEAAWLDEASLKVASALSLEREAVFSRIRQRQSGASQYNRLDKKKRELTIEEYGLRFLVNLSDYLDTGLFLDHRPTRRLVRDISQGLKVLNLFSYTGAFSVVAAAGGAHEVCSVDLSNTYLTWANRNIKLNKQPDSIHELVRADILGWLDSVKAKKRYGLIILDPPSFSNSKSMKETFDIQRDHVSLIRKSMALLTESGSLLFSSNRRGFRLDEAELKGFRIEDLSRKSCDPDFERRPAHKLYKICE